MGLSEEKDFGASFVCVFFSLLFIFLFSFSLSLSLKHVIYIKVLLDH